MASSIDKLAKELKNQIAASDERKPRPYDTQAEVLRVENGVAWVHIPGGVDETPVRLTINAKKGDTVNIHVANGTAWITGNSTNPPTDDSTANYAVDISNEVKKEVTVLHTTVVDVIEATDARFETVEADTAKIHTLTAEKILATVGYIDDLTADSITAQDISAASGYIKDLEADNITAQDISAATGYIGDLTAGNVTAQNVIADHATVGSLDTNYAHITNGVIDNAKIGYADVDGLNANYAHISNGTIDNAKIDQADVNNLNANYAQINLANVNNAWIENGLIKDAAISDAQILGVSANKLTAGTIDASNITVTNLNASNITTGSITVDGITIDVENNEASIDGSYIEDGTITMNGFSQEVKDVIDGAIETFTGTVVPTLNNAPASSWTTTKLKDQHVGDVYYVVNSSSQQNGYCYRFSKSGSTYSWQLIKDSDVTAALSRLTTAEGKIGDIEEFDEEIATFKTETEGEISTLQTKTTSLETSLGDKVDTSTFNTLSQTVDGNSASITELSTITTNNGLTKTTNITNTVNTVSQTATGNSSKISSLTNTLGTNADGTTKAGDIVHRTSAVEQDLSGFKTTVSKTYHKTSDFNTYKAANDTAVAAAKKAGDDAQADLDEYKGTVSETYATKSSLTQTAEGIRTDVSSTYETKTDASAKLTEAKGDATTKANKALTDAKADTTNKLKSYYTKTETDSAITQKAGEISLSVAQTEIAKIEVGGRNLVPVTHMFSGSGRVVPSTNQSYINTVSNARGCTLCHTSDILADLVPSTVGEGEEIVVSFDFKMDSGGDASHAITFYAYQSNGISIAPGNHYLTADEKQTTWTRITRVTNAYNFGDLNTSRTIGSINFYDSTGKNYFSIRNVKIERGNKATDWTPAPEDAEAYTDSQVSAAKAEIKVTTDGISTEVAKKTDKETIISTIRQSAESVKIKASQVEIDGTATFNAIKSSTDAAYDAKGAAQTAVDGIEVGGRNIMASTTQKSMYKCTVTAYDKSYNGVTVTTTENGGTLRFLHVIDESNIPYTITFVCTSSVATSVFIDAMDNTIQTFPIIAGTTKVVCTTIPTKAVDSTYHFIDVKFNAIGTYKLANIKIEKGNKATDWTPAPEDVQAEIDAKKSVHTLMSNSNGSTYANILTWTEEGHANSSWGIDTSKTPLTNVKIGDTCRVAYKVTDMNGAYVYPTGVVTNIGTNTVTMTMHGLDTTIIDGGNILTNSIGANQIAANAVTADKIAANAITIGDMDSSTASKVNNGDSALTKVNYYSRTCHVGNTSNTQTNYWRKFASYTETRQYADPYIIFDVMSSGDTSTYKQFGRLKAHIRTSSKGTIDANHSTLQWINRGEGIILSDFVMAYKATSGTDVKIELWCKCDKSWTGYRFNMVQEGDRVNQATSAMWTMYDSFTADGVASITSGYTQVSSTDIDAARTTATSYITDIDSNNGIRIHPASTENNSAVINADGLEIFKGGTTRAYSVAKYGDTARIGKESGSHLTLAPGSMSMSDGTKDVFNLLQKTMYIYWTRNYKGRQFANSTDRYVDSWETNTTISTWDSISVNYKLNNTSKTKKITSISNGVLVNDEIYVHFNYSGTIITLTYGRGSSAASSDIIKLESAVVYYVTDEKLSQLHTGTYPNTTMSGALRIGNGTSDSNRINLMLVDWSGTGKFKGDILAFCGADSSGGMSLTKAEENIDAFKYEAANGRVYINAYRVGRIVSLLCTVSKTTSTAAGANLYQLDLTNAHLPKPLGTNTSGTGISSGNMIIGNIYYNKTVTPNRYEFVCRNGGSTAASTVSVGFTITYICQMDEVSGEIKYMDD